MRETARVTTLAGCMCFLGAVSCGIAGSLDQQTQAGAQARVAGNTYESIAVLEAAARAAPNGGGTATLTELGQSLAQAGRLADAEAVLQRAYAQTSPDARYPVALALGNLAERMHDTERASRYYHEVMATTASGPQAQDARVFAQLDDVALLPPYRRVTLLDDLLPVIARIEDSDHRARAYFYLAQQASEAPGVASLGAARQGKSSGDAVAEHALRVAFQGFDAARRLAGETGDRVLEVEAQDALADLYESQGRFRDALELNRRGLQAINQLPSGSAGLVSVRLEWRAGRLEQRLGHETLARASFLRAAQQLESIRQDLPIEDMRGKSTFQRLERPIFAGLADLSLKDIDSLPPAQQQSRMIDAVGVIELSRQAELQDYLGDRCSVDSVQQGAVNPVVHGVAVLYPVVLRDRLEIILKTEQGLAHHAVPITSVSLQDAVRTLRSDLTDSGTTNYLESAHRLYTLLLAEFEPALAAAGIDTLVVVPDGYLRLIPFGALHDGKRFVAERFAVSTVTGLSMTEPGVPNRQKPRFLLAGLSSPGPVVDQLVTMGFAGVSGTGLGTAARSTGGTASGDTNVPPVDAAALRNKLALPGVKTEIAGLVPLAHGEALLNADFTVERFEHEVQSGNFRIVHVASHGFFGDSADRSFLLAYDNVIRLTDLQRLIAPKAEQSLSIDLLTLSACDTATGDDRAPLGFAGAAIKARARSVIGTLWEVSDSATQVFMQDLYTSLAQHGKAQALAEAQRKLIGSGQFSHPFYWAPFVLTGDWN